MVAEIWRNKMINLEELSKEVSYALRHAPWEYELELDEEGWVSLEQLITSFNESSKWIAIKEEDVIEMINKSSKKRHEIKSNKIRALYGHSIPKKILKIESEPPDVLYHGTTQSNRQYLEVRVASAEEAICTFIRKYRNSNRCWKTS